MAPLSALFPPNAKTKQGVNVPTDATLWAHAPTWATATAIAKTLTLSEPSPFLFFDAVAGLGTVDAALLKERLVMAYLYEPRPAFFKDVLPTNLARFAPKKAQTFFQPVPFRGIPPLPEAFGSMPTFLFVDLASSVASPMPAQPLTHWVFSAPDVTLGLVLSNPQATLPTWIALRVPADTPSPSSKLTATHVLPDGSLLFLLRTTGLTPTQVGKRFGTKQTVRIRETPDIRSISPRPAQEEEEPGLTDHEATLQSFLRETFLPRFIPSSDMILDVTDASLMPLWSSLFTTSDADPNANYEQSEFVGDRLLEAPFILTMLQRYPDATTSILTKLKTGNLNKKVQGDKAAAWGFGELIQSPDPITQSTLEDVSEAFTAGLFLTGESVQQGLGFLLVRTFVQFMFEDDTFDLSTDQSNPKTLVLKFFKRQGIEMDIRETKDAGGARTLLRAPGFGVLADVVAPTKAAASRKAFQDALLLLKRKHPDIDQESTQERVLPGTPLPEGEDETAWEAGLLPFIRTLLTQRVGAAVAHRLTDTAAKQAVWMAAFSADAQGLATFHQFDLLGHLLLEGAFALTLLKRMQAQGVELEAEELTNIKIKYLDIESMAQRAAALGFASQLLVRTVEERAALHDTTTPFERFGITLAPKRAEAEQRFREAVRRFGAAAMPTKDVPSPQRDLLAATLFAFTAALYTTGEQTSQGLGFLLVRQWTEFLYKDTIIDMTVTHLNPVSVLKQTYEQVGLTWTPKEWERASEDKGQWTVSIVFPTAVQQRFATVGLKEMPAVIGQGRSQELAIATQLAYNDAVQFFERQGLTLAHFKVLKQARLKRRIDARLVTDLNKRFGAQGWTLTTKSAGQDQTLYRLLTTDPDGTVTLRARMALPKGGDPSLNGLAEQALA